MLLRNLNFPLHLWIRILIDKRSWHPRRCLHPSKDTMKPVTDLANLATEDRKWIPSPRKSALQNDSRKKPRRGKGSEKKQMQSGRRRSTSDSVCKKPCIKHVSRERMVDDD
jgi:hypothetical protein